MADLRERRCYFCRKPLEQRSAAKLQVCGECPESAMWQAIWRQQRRQPTQAADGIPWSDCRPPPRS
jgi:hypothetical protein